MSKKKIENFGKNQSINKIANMLVSNKLGNTNSLLAFVYSHFDEVINELVKLGINDRNSETILIKGRTIDLQDLNTILTNYHRDPNKMKNALLDSDVIKKPEASEIGRIFVPRLRVQISPDLVVAIESGDSGIAYYDEINNRFECYTICNFFHQFSHDVLVDGIVKCIVIDDGAEIMSFEFSIGNFIVGQGEEKQINFATHFNSNTPAHNKFYSYKKLRLDFIFQSSEKPTRAGNNWMAMADINISLNFIGDYTYDERLIVQSIINSNVNSMIENQGLFVGKSITTSILPSDPDYTRFKDILINSPINTPFSSDEANELRTKWNGTTNMLDIFIVETFSYPINPVLIGGLSPIDGPVEKNTKKSGVLIEGRRFDFLSSDSEKIVMAIYIAHYIGHFLGLKECDSDDNCTDSLLNFMQEPYSTYTPVGSFYNFQFTRDQFLKIVQHGFVKRLSSKNISI